MAPPPPPQAPPPPLHQPPAAQAYPPPQYQAPPQYQQPPQYQPAPTQPTYVLQEPKRGLPSWLVGLLVTALIGGALFGVYKFVGGNNGSAGKTEKTQLEKVGSSPVEAAGGVYGKFVEVTGYRLLETSDKKLKLRFTVVNHSPAPMSGLALQISLGRAGEETAPPFAVVDAPVGDIEAYGAKEIELPLKTSLRVYELPDWQFIRGVVSVTAPK